MIVIIKAQAAVGELGGKCYYKSFGTSPKIAIPNSVYKPEFQLPLNAEVKCYDGFVCCPL